MFLKPLLLLIVYPTNYINIYKEKKINFQPAPQTYQLGFKESLESNKVSCLNVSFIPLGTFPFRSSILFVKYHFSDNTHFLPFVNLMFLKNISRIFSFFIFMTFNIKKFKGINTIFNYSLFLPGQIISILLNFFLGIKNTIIVPDLLGTYGLKPKNLIKLFHYEFISFFALFFLNYYSRYIFLSDKMKTLKYFKNKPFSIIEGFVSSPLIKPILEKKKIRYPFNIVFTGSIINPNEFDSLITIAKKYPKRYRVLISGEGPYKYQLISKIKDTTNIRYEGFLTGIKLTNLYKNAGVFVNLRKNDIYTMYSFPSKTLVYLKYFKPVVMFKLDGIPAEYGKFLEFIDDSKLESLENKINQISNYTPKQLNLRSIELYKFLQTKTPSFLGKIIIRDYEK